MSDTAGWCFLHRNNKGWVVPVLCSLPDVDVNYCHHCGRYLGEVPSHYIRCYGAIWCNTLCKETWEGIHPEAKDGK